MEWELGRFNNELNEIHAADALFSSSARIRRALLDETADNRDYFGDIFRSKNLRHDARMLNVGSGDGLDEARLAIELGHTGEIVGIDLPSLEDSIQLEVEAEPAYQSRENEEFYNRFIVAQILLEEAGINNVKFMPGDAEALDFPDNSFDFVMWNGSGYYFRNVVRALKQTQRVLTPGGIFLNLTNGPDNKLKHHEIVERIKTRLEPEASARGVKVHVPLSSSFNLPMSQVVISSFFELVEPIYQKSVYQITRDRLPYLINSIDTYRPTLPKGLRDEWVEERNCAIEELVIPEIDNNGAWEDSVERGGGFYRNSKVAA